MPRQIDPITFEVLKNALTSVVDDMVVTIVRTAYSGVIKGVMDFSTAFCDAQGQMIVQGLSLPQHLGSMPEAMAAVLNRFGDDIHPDDIFILNDPFEGGMHLPDIFIIRPAYVEGVLLGFAVSVCHHTDVGGRVPGSNASDSTEIYQEGLRIPPCRLYHAGVPDDSLFRLIEANVRVPVKVLGDLRAQRAAGEMAERGMRRLADRYGLETLQAYFKDSLDYAEQRTRAAFAEWPDGRYEFVDYLDDDGIDQDPIVIKVALTVRGDEVEADFTGSSLQVKGAINPTLSFTQSTVYAAIRYVLGPDIPNNAGYFRPIKVIAPPGTIVNSVWPAAHAARGVTGFRIGDAVFGALAKIHPTRVFAAGEGGNTGVTIGGYQNREPFIFVDFVCSSWGAFPHRDGLDGNTNPFENLAAESVEVVELEQPLRIERYEFIPDSGGAGTFRGGLGTLKAYRLLADEAILQVRADRQRFQPYGLAGGGPGSPSRNVVNPDTDQEETLPPKFTRMMRKDDVFLHWQPGGGGFGDPFKRDPDRVASDVQLGKVSRDAARRAYGVVLTPDGKVDWAATKQCRQRNL